MAYCVNCGVKLSKSELKCPLCDTPILKYDKNEYVPAYSSNIEVLKKINYKFVIRLINLCLIILALITVLCNLIISKELSWSIYVLISVLYWCSLTNFIYHKNIYISLIMILISTEIFMLIISLLNNGISWYLCLVMPYVLITWIYVFICVLFIKKKKKHLLRYVSISIILSSVSLIGIECGIDLFCDEFISLTWSIYASIPIIVIGLLLFILSFNHKIVDEIKQRIFI